MQTRKIITLAILVISLILTGCSSTKTPTVSLDGTRWLLTRLPSGPALTDTTVTIEFLDGKIDGSDGCNSYGGTVIVKGSKITVGEDMASTLMACPDPIMQQASAFYEALKKSASYQVDGQQLMLLDASGQIVATFTRQSSE